MTSRSVARTLEPNHRTKWPTLSYELTIKTILLISLLCAAPLTARALDISTPEIAEELCVTADVAPTYADSPDRPVDPLVRTQHRHHYTSARLARLTDVYAVMLDTDQYAFLPSAEDVLAVDVLEPFSLFGGLYALDLGPSPDVAFFGTEAMLETVRAGAASDQILLRLEFHLVSLDNPESSYCVSDGESVRIVGRLLAATLVNRTDLTPIAQTQTARLRSGRVRFGFEIGRRYVPPQPRVQVTATAFPADEPPGDESEFLRVEAETRLMPCYIHGLSQNGRLQGAIVVSYRIAEDGQVSDTTITIDAVDQPLLTGCAVGSLSEIAVPREIPHSPYDVRMTVIFRLD